MNVLIWFKRDLRIHDHPALAHGAQLAHDLGGAVLPLYIAEADIWALPDASARQWEGVADALGDLRADLATIGAPLLVRVGGAVDVLTRLCKRARITHIVSHMEVGCLETYARDRAVAAWARSEGIIWTQLPQSGLRRGGVNGRAGWAAQRDAFAAADMVEAPAKLRAVDGIEAGPIPPARALRLASDPTPHRQNAGRVAGLACLDSFLAARGVGYSGGISSPLTAERACARISPHLALGSLSSREVAHALAQRRSDGMAGNWNRSLTAFESRLAWRDHFMQKLEDQPNLHQMAMQPSTDTLGRSRDPARLAAWSAGQTGLPYIDASMRYLNATGWINFRARAMLVSFATYHLWLDWRLVGQILARKFTDYEPGIHWPQVQMQSGVTGVNIPRIYNPVKQGLDQDPTGRFTRRWLPELAAVPDTYLQNPWRWSGAGGVLGRRYPEPMIEPARALSDARAKLATVRAAPKARSEAIEVIERHVTQGRARRTGAFTGASNGALPARKSAPDAAQLMMDF
jgi:deoxyribodipyrimidine photo-lyase